MGESHFRFTNNTMQKLFILVIATLCFSELVLGEVEVRSTVDDYNLVTCVEPQRVDPENDAEIDKHCSHESVNATSLPVAEDGDASDRWFFGFQMLQVLRTVPC